VTRRLGMIAALFAILFGATAGCAPERAMEAGWVLADLAAGGGRSPLKERRRQPRRSAVADGDLYEPADGAPVSGLVLVPGAARTGKDDPRLVALADTMARARFAVLIPDLPNLRDLRIGPADIDGVAAAVDWLAARHGAPVGVAAVSYAAGPAILAAARPGTAQKVRFVAAIGGYYDLGAALTFFTTGYYREPPAGPWRWRRPNAYGKWVFVGGNAGRLADPRDRSALSEMARRKLADIDADLSDLRRLLGTEGRAVMDLLDNGDPERVPALVARLPPGIRADMAALDPARADLRALRARLILVHGRDDAIVPYTESLALAAAAPPGQVDLFLLNSLAHADLRPGGMGDAARLWWAVYRLLVERDRPPGRPPAARRTGG